MFKVPLRDLQKVYIRVTTGLYQVAERFGPRVSASSIGDEGLG